MKSIGQRSLDFYRLKPTYRYLLGGFFVPGLIAGMLLVASRGYEAQIAKGLTPGAPLGSEPGSISHLFQFMALTLVAGLVGMALGGVLLSLVLAALTRVSLRDAFGVVFLSKYPHGWFREVEAKSE